MKRLVASLLAASMLSASLAACGSQPPASEPVTDSGTTSAAPAADDLSEKLTISVNVRDSDKVGKDARYAGCNSLQCEWVSNRWWVYKTTFHLDADWKNTDALEVCFDGIDYKAHIYHNGCKLGEHEGVCLPFTADIAPFMRFDGCNTLVCVVESAPDEYAKFGYTPKVKTLKPRYNYYWDFSTRLVSIGLYGDVRLHGYEAAALRHTRIHTRPVTDATWEISAQMELDCFQRQTLTVGAVLSRNAPPPAPYPHHGNAW